MRNLLDNPLLLLVLAFLVVVVILGAKKLLGPERRPGPGDDGSAT